MGICWTRQNQVITGYFGEKQRPLVGQYMDHGKMDADDQHRHAWFADDQLGRMRLTPQLNRLTIDRTFSWLEEDGSAFVVQGEMVANMRVDLSEGAPTLPEELGDWQPALNGLYERVNCRERLNCAAPHYASSD